MPNRYCPKKVTMIRFYVYSKTSIIVGKSPSPPNHQKILFWRGTFLNVLYSLCFRGQRGGANVLIFAPTRELAQQIASEVKNPYYMVIL